MSVIFPSADDSCHCPERYNKCMSWSCFSTAQYGVGGIMQSVWYKYVHHSYICSNMNCYHASGEIYSWCSFIVESIVMYVINIKLMRYVYHIPMFDVLVLMVSLITVTVKFIYPCIKQIRFEICFVSIKHIRNMEIRVSWIEHLNMANINVKISM